MFSQVLVVALSGLIVEPQHAYLVDHEGQTVLEGMTASLKSPGQLPNCQICKPAFANDSLFTKQESGLHVGIYTNDALTVNAARTAQRRLR